MADPQPDPNPDPAADYAADLTAAPIFDDAIYRCEALSLAEGESEEQLDAQLAVAARNAGVEDPDRFLCPEVQDMSTAMSTMTVSSAPRSSMSIHSRETQSTGVTSHPSRTSRDYHYLEGAPSMRPGLFPRMSLSSDDYYDSMMGRFRSSRHRTSSSLPGPNSHAPPKASSRKQKRASGYGLFSMFRRDSSTCASRAPHGHHTKPTSPKLDCGHTLSKYAIRVHIQEALQTKEAIAPNCCGKPLPKSVLATVLTPEEIAIVTPIPSPPTDSGYSEDGASSIDVPRNPVPQTRHAELLVATANDSPREAVPKEQEELFEKALLDESFKALRTEQVEQFRRVSTFEQNQRKALSAYHQWSLRRLTARFEANEAEKARQHAFELERLDESQIIAEHDLRKAHAQETQNVATALKYMEAYCSGSNPMDPTTAHTVTEEDRKKLARQHLTRQKLPAKHESAINVLRARQEKDTRIKLQKQEAELRQLIEACEQDKRGEELQYMKRLAQLEGLVKERRARVMHRWDLKFEMWRREWAKEHGTVLHAPISQLHEAWPETRSETSGAPELPEVDPSSALALYVQVKA